MYTHLKTAHHLTQVRIAITKKTRNNKCWRGCGILIHCWWKCKFPFPLIQMLQPLWKTVWRFLKIVKKKKKKNRATIWSSNPTSWYMQKKVKCVITKRYLHPHVHTVWFTNSQDIALSVYQWMSEWRKYNFIHTHTHSEKCYSTIKRREILPFVITGMNLGNIMLSKINQAQRDKH